MIKQCVIYCCVLIALVSHTYAQKVDAARDTVSVAASVATIKLPDSTSVNQTLSYYDTVKVVSDLSPNAFYLTMLSAGGKQFLQRGALYVDSPHEHSPKELVFYLLLFITTILAFVLFYFDDYFVLFLRSFSQPSIRFNQTKENISRGYIPSFLLNMIFVFCTGLLAALYVEHYWHRFNVFQIFVFFSLLITLLYLLKFFILKITGYLLNNHSVTNTYIYIIFLVNRYIGLILLALLWLVAFNRSIVVVNHHIPVYYWIVGISISLLMVYRYLTTFLLIKDKVKITLLHFFLYLCAVEVIPLLVAYKLISENINSVL